LYLYGTGYSSAVRSWFALAEIKAISINPCQKNINAKFIRLFYRWFGYEEKALLFNL